MSIHNERGGECVYDLYKYMETIMASTRTHNGKNHNPTYKVCSGMVACTGAAGGGRALGAATTVGLGGAAAVICGGADRCEMAGVDSPLVANAPSPKPAATKPL